MSLTFLGCSGQLAGTYELASIERDGEDFTAAYLRTRYTSPCGDADTVGLTLLSWDAGFRWREAPRCSDDEVPVSYAQYLFVDRRFGRRFQLSPYSLEGADDEPWDCVGRSAGVDCDDPANGRPITFRFRPREDA